VIQETWASTAVESAEVVFYRGGSLLRDEGRELELPVSDALDRIGEKTLRCFEHVLEHREFDLVFRTNLSSYVDLPNLHAYARDAASPTGFYAGRGGTIDDIRFVGGAGYFLSRDLVQAVVEDGADWDHHYLDDVALAKLLAARGVSQTWAPRVDLRRPRDVAKADLGYFHYRCKTTTRGRRGDMEIMRRLHDRFLRLRGAEAPRRDRSIRWWLART
jgi:hypothetical protein